MTDMPNASIRVQVDLTNPGQFFACCGILELADRLWSGGAEGWFERNVFKVSTIGNLRELLIALVQHLPSEVTLLNDCIRVKPLIAPLLLSLSGKERNQLLLDSWMAIATIKGEVEAIANPPWNFWSGQQTSLRIWTALREALTTQLGQTELIHSEAVFSQRIQLSGRFGFDPGAAWNALDAGFSPNEQKLDVASSPAVEMLAAIGVQRFKPEISKNRQSFTYAAWGLPLPTFVAAVAAAGCLDVGATRRYEGRVVSRGSYAALGFATLLKGTDDD